MTVTSTFAVSGYTSPRVAMWIPNFIYIIIANYSGILPGAGFRTDRLRRFGYQTLCAPADSLLFRAGERVPVHEFHYWDATEHGADFSFTKPISGRAWRGGFASPTLYAGFPHLYFAGKPELAARLVAAAENYQTLRGI